MSQLHISTSTVYDPKRYLECLLFLRFLRFVFDFFIFQTAAPTGTTDATLI